MGYMSPTNFESDRIERSIDTMRDAMNGRHEGKTVVKHEHHVANYVSHFGNAELIKKDFNTDLQRAQGNNAEACLRVGRAYLYGTDGVRVNLEQAMSFLSTAKEKGMAGAAELLREAEARKNMPKSSNVPHKTRCPKCGKSVHNLETHLAVRHGEF